MNFMENIEHTKNEKERKVKTFFPPYFTVYKSILRLMENTINFSKSQELEFSSLFNT